jgi:xylulokinase
MSLMGIDIGTTGCKAAAFSEDGTCIAQAYREYLTLHPAEGQAELESEEVWSKTREVLSTLTNSKNDRRING